MAIEQRQRRIRLSRLTLYRRVCERAGLSPVKRTLGYFTRRQMAELVAYLDSVDSGLERLNNQLDQAIAGAVTTCSSNQGQHPQPTR